MAMAIASKAALQDSSIRLFVGYGSNESSNLFTIHIIIRLVSYGLNINKKSKMGQQQKIRIRLKMRNDQAQVMHLTS